MPGGHRTAQSTHLKGFTMPSSTAPPTPLDVITTKTSEAEATTKSTAAGGAK